MSLFRSSEPRPPTEKIETVLGPSSSFRGELKAQGGVRLDGAFDGTLESESNVIVGENANVAADIAGFNVTVAGKVIGDISAVGRLEILATGYVRGDISASSLLIEEGGIFRGQSLRDDEGTPEPEAEGPARQRRSPKSEQTIEEDSATDADTQNSEA
jgi:cytoskeletal protein CcmA (bactofilin family)